MRASAEKRISKRIHLEVPVHMGEVMGTTRDVSGTGVYFTTNQAFSLDEYIKFSLELAHIIPDKPLQLNCQGHVVRVESRGDHLGVAAQIDKFYCLH